MRLVSVLLGLVLSMSAYADIGSVTELSGTASVKRGKDIIAVAKGNSIETNDRVITKNGRVTITFKDNTTVKVTESSELLIDDFVYDAKSGAGKLGLKAVGGTVRYVSGNIAHNNPNAVKINTPTAAIAVRGTDFVMSVSETGSSMIILMPTCEENQIVNLKGMTCGSGKIDVDSGGTRVTLDRPYQATVVETAGNPPSEPVVVNLTGMTIGNNLLLSEPKTARGANVVATARAATDKTGDSKAERHDREAQKEAQDQNQNRSQARDTAAAAVRTLELSDKLVTEGVKLSDVADNPYIYKIWQDQSKTQQTGWGYGRLNAAGNNYVNIALTMDTKSLVVVTQDYNTDAYNSNTLSSRSYGTIIINQSYR